MLSIILFLFYFLTPLLIIFLCNKSKVLKRVGAVIITYITGIIIGNIGLIPKGSDAFINLLSNKIFVNKKDALELFQLGVIKQKDLTLNQIASDQFLIMTIVICLSIPLLLFSLELKNSLRIFKKVLFPISITILALFTIGIIGNYLFKESIPNIAKISGMMTGLFIGGIPTLATLASTFEITPNLFFIVQIFHFLIGGLILLFLFSPSNRFVKPNLHQSDENERINEIINTEVHGKLSENFSIKTILQLTGACCISFLIVTISYLISSILPLQYQRASTFLLITLIGELFCLIYKIKTIEKMFELGMYFILVFCFVVSSMVDFRTIFQIGILYFFLYYFVAISVTIMATFIISAIFKINIKNKLSNIWALIIPNPFLSFAANALKNNEIVTTGITIGVFGIAIGNFLGILFTYILGCL